MSTIDSGLGWSCDSDYYVNAAGLLGTYGGKTISKNNNVGAICVNYQYNDGTNPIIYGAFIISTDASAVVCSGTLGHDVDTSIVDNVTWYRCNIYYPNTGASSEILTDFSVLNTIFTPSTTNQTQIVLEESGVQFTAKKIPTTDYVKAFVEGVEAETATRVNALDTAKQPKTMSAAVSVGGVQQNTVENAISAMATKISKIDFDIHRNLGTEITAAQKLAIANGTFEDLPIGAYWTLNGTVYRIAHHDYYLGTGDTECASHHIVVVPDNAMYSAKMNDTGTTTGGYAGSKMRTTNLATALSTFETDFGAAHILNHRILITNAVTNGQASGRTWVDSKVDLMSENMVYGHTVWGQTGYEIGVGKGQLVLFSLYPEFIHKRAHQCWLRSIGTDSSFCVVNGNGFADYSNASNSFFVRPYACIYFDDVLT